MSVISGPTDITLTAECKEHPGKPYFVSGKVVFTGIYVIFLSIFFRIFRTIGGESSKETCFLLGFRMWFKGVKISACLIYRRLNVLIIVWNLSFQF